MTQKKLNRQVIDYLAIGRVVPLLSQKSFDDLPIEVGQF
jgi:hypothetical protein